MNYSVCKHHGDNLLNILYESCAIYAIKNALADVITVNFCLIVCEAQKISACASENIPR